MEESNEAESAQFTTVLRQRTPTEAPLQDCGYRRMNGIDIHNAHADATRNGEGVTRARFEPSTRSVMPRRRYGSEVSGA